MRAVVQRVLRARVTVETRVAGEISGGVLILLGVGRADNTEAAMYLAGKIANLRIFPDIPRDPDTRVVSEVGSGDAGKMNRSLLDVAGSALVVSQFTLYGDTRGGRRPSYIQAAPPTLASELYEEFVRSLGSLGVHVETGVFQAHMEIELVNDGPVTILLDSEKVF